MARLVLNHSTFIEGLLPLLRRLAAELEDGVVIPGVIGRTRGRTESLMLKLSPRCPLTGSYKILCRRGRTVQEVLVVSKAPQDHVEGALDRTCRMPGARGLRGFASMAA